MINWTSEMHAYLIELHGHAEDLTFREIAQRMSERFEVLLTRNACIGKALRLGLPTRPGSHGGVRTRERRMPPKLIKIDAPIEPRVEVVPDLPGISIYQLKHRSCRWPLGPPMERPPFRYCGCRTVLAGMPYCAEHTRIATGKSYEPRQRQAV